MSRSTGARRWALLIPWCLAACVAEPVDQVASAPAAITGGALDLDDPAVVAIVQQPVACQGTETLVCTGTLIGERAVLAAAHCLDPGAIAALVVRAGASLDDPGASSSPVVAEYAHPEAGPGTADLGVLELGTLLAVTPAPFADAAPGELIVGASVRIVGFGRDEDGVTGIKRDGTAVVTSVAGDRFEIGPAPGMSCTGDSGGPVYLDTASGEIVAGVTSSGDPACDSLGVNMRVDAFAGDFVVPTVAAIAAAPAPAMRAPLHDRADLCAAECSDDADCPTDTACVARDDGGGRACGFRGISPGRFTDSCIDDRECPGGFCAAARGGPCRCYLPCAEPGGGGSGCRVSPGSGSTPLAAVLLVVATMAWWPRLTRRLRTRAARSAPDRDRRRSDRGQRASGHQPRTRAPRATDPSRHSSSRS